MGLCVRDRYCTGRLLYGKRGLWYMCHSYSVADRGFCEVITLRSLLRSNNKPLLRFLGLTLIDDVTQLLRSLDEVAKSSLDQAQVQVLHPKYALLKRSSTLSFTF
jgi:hypothetical protein